MEISNIGFHHLCNFKDMSTNFHWSILSRLLEWLTYFKSDSIECLLVEHQNKVLSYYKTRY